jgi:hypothetical protein
VRLSLKLPSFTICTTVKQQDLRGGGQGGGFRRGELPSGKAPAGRPAGKNSSRQGKPNQIFWKIAAVFLFRVTKMNILVNLLPVTDYAE